MVIEKCPSCGVLRVQQEKLPDFCGTIKIRGAMDGEVLKGIKHILYGKIIEEKGEKVFVVWGYYL